MAIQAVDLADLGALTLNNLGKLKWTDLTLSLQKLVALPKMLKKERVKFDDGKGHQWNIQASLSGNASNIGLFEVIQPAVTDTMIQGSIPWRHTNVHYSYDRRELAMNRGAARIVDLLKTRRSDAMNSLAKLMEEDFWSKPTDSTDTRKPFGIKYWVVPSASAGFNGTNPSGFTSGAGNVSSTTYPKWANYTDRYVNITKTDLVAKWRQAAVKTDFESPIDVSDYSNGKARYGYYMNYDVLGALESMLEDQNENLGNDVASKDGKTLFRGVPCTYVSQLDSDTTDPVYGIDWAVFHPVFLSGEYMREEGPTKNPSQPSVYTTHIDTTYNWCCYNRRSLFIVDKA